MKNTIVLIVVVVVLGGGLWWYFSRDNELSVTAIEADDPVVTPATPYTATVDEPEQPVDPMPEEEQEPIPDLENSDPWVRERITREDPWLDQILDHEHLVRKITVAGDLILRDKNPNSQLFFLKPIEDITVSKRDDKLYLSDQTYKRFDHAVSILESLDNEMLAKTYRLGRPLFDMAWNELGNGTKWDDQVDPILEKILAVEPVEGDIELFESGGAYMFADEDLESLPALNKAFIRMGPDHLKRIQRKLISIRESMD